MINSQSLNITSLNLIISNFGVNYMSVIVKAKIKEQSEEPTHRPFPATHPWMHDEAVSQDQRYIKQFYTKQDVPHLDCTMQPLQTTIAWALRPDIDFHTEVNVLRKWFTDDYSNDIKYNAKIIQQLKKHHEVLQH